MIGTVYRDEQSGKLLNSIVTAGNPDFPYELTTKKSLQQTSSRAIW